MSYLKYLSALCFFFAIFFEFLDWLWLNKLYRAAQNMQAVSHKLLKQILLRFTNCAKLNIPIVNTSAFVKRYLENYTFLGFHYGFFKELGTFFSMLGVGFSLLGIYLYSDTFYQYGVFTVLCSIIYAFFCQFMNHEKQTGNIVTLITDYLDNTLCHRITPQITKREPESPAAATQEPIHQPTPPKSNSISRENEDVIFSVINDFLI